VNPEQDRIYLSPPSVSETDIDAVEAAMRSGWVAPVGPDLDLFEQEMAAYLGVRHAVAMSSGTAGLHLAMKSRGVLPGDVVLVPTVTFGATAFAVTYLGAVPAFVDVDDSWNMDPELVAKSVSELRAAGKRVTAIVPVDLYGTPANYDSLSPLHEELEVAIIEDAAEGLGGRHRGRALGSFGDAAVLSFNGNKIITTSGGGMLLTDDHGIAASVRHWSTQSREALPWYEHHEIGYNYRMSNILAALGRSQMSRIDEIVAARRAIRERYRSALLHIEGLHVQEDPAWGQSNAWLTVIRISTDVHPNGSAQVREYLEARNVESRPVWKPMHQQPIFEDNPTFLTGAADALYREGLCLPSGTQLRMQDVDVISGMISDALRKR